MERVFADTGYWIALLNPRDSLHTIAVATSRQYGASQIVTSQMILAEFLNAFSDRGTNLRQAATRVVTSLRESSHVIIAPQTSQLFGQALRKYREMADKGWSFTDCASFLIMEELRLTAALTHDRHFAQAGFRILLR